MKTAFLVRAISIFTLIQISVFGVAHASFHTATNLKVVGTGVNVPNNKHYIRVSDATISSSCGSGVIWIIGAAEGTAKAAYTTAMTAMTLNRAVHFLAYNKMTNGSCELVQIESK